MPLPPLIRTLSQTSPMSAAMHSLPKSLRSNGGLDYAKQCQLFDFFRYNTIPANSAFLPSQFWTSDVLKLAHEEPAIWHAVCCLGALHQQRQEGKSQDMTHQPTFFQQNIGHSTATLMISHLPTQECEKQYLQAAMSAIDLKDDTRAVVLSLILSTAANNMGHIAESRMHLMAGRNIMVEINKRQHVPQELGSTMEMFSRLELEAMTIGEVSAPFDIVDTEILSRQGLNHNIHGRYGFPSYEEATKGLISLLRRIMIAGNVPSVTLDFGATVPFIREVNDWEEMMIGLELAKGPSENLNEHDKTAAISIRLYHSLLYLFLNLAALGPQSRFDTDLDLFSRIVILAEALIKRWNMFLTSCSVSLTMEPGIVMPIFAVISRCRHSRLRRRALRLLQRMHRHEGVWRSDTVAVFAKIIIDIEEGALPITMYPLESEVGSTDESFDAWVASADWQDQLEETMAYPWRSWSRHDRRLPCFDNWLGVVPIPEENRIKEFAPSVATAQGCYKLSFIMEDWEEIGFGEHLDHCVPA